MSNEIRLCVDLEHVLRDFKVVKIIDLELLKAIDVEDPNKESLIHNELNSLFSGIDFTASFNEKLIIVHSEVIIPEIVTGLHSWLSTKCCNIQNIVLIVNHNFGVEEWYSRYLDLYGQIGFKVIDAPMLKQNFSVVFEEMKPFELLDERNIRHYCSYYGGTYSTLERDFLASMMIDTGAVNVEYMGGFKTDPTKFDNYLEQLTMFMDRSTVDRLISIKNNKQIVSADNKVDYLEHDKIEMLYRSSTQADNYIYTACHVNRETLNNIPFLAFTEKTLRGFINQQIPIPLGIRNVEQLEQLGFRMDYDIVNYDYQYETNFYKRIAGACEQIKNLKDKYTLKDLSAYLNSKQDTIKHNYIRSAEFYKQINQNLLEKLNGI